MSGRTGKAIYPQTEVQLCIVHVVRASLNYVPWKMRKPVAADLQAIYRATTAAEAEHGLQELEAKWKTYPSVSQVLKEPLHRGCLARIAFARASSSLACGSLRASTEI
jgi:transposase-like protein